MLPHAEGLRFSECVGAETPWFGTAAVFCGWVGIGLPGVGTLMLRVAMFLSGGMCDAP